jgi:hypothetical protein
MRNKSNRLENFRDGREWQQAHRQHEYLGLIALQTIATMKRRLCASADGAAAGDHHGTVFHHFGNLIGASHMKASVTWN